MLRLKQPSWSPATESQPHCRITACSAQQQHGSKPPSATTFLEVCSTGPADQAPARRKSCVPPAYLHCMPIIQKTYLCPLWIGRCPHAAEHLWTPGSLPHVTCGSLAAPPTLGWKVAKVVVASWRNASQYMSSLTWSLSGTLTVKYLQAHGGTPMSSRQQEQRYGA